MHAQRGLRARHIARAETRQGNGRPLSAADYGKQQGGLEKQIKTVRYVARYNTAKGRYLLPATYPFQ